LFRFFYCVNLFATIYRVQTFSMNETLLIGSIVGSFLVVCILCEAVVIALFRLNRFARAIASAALVNAITIAVMFVVWPLVSSMDIDEDKVFPLLPILFFTAILVEGTVLWLLNRTVSAKKIFLVSAVMNTVSFGALYLILSLI
jgi:hypothetical protein